MPNTGWALFNLFSSKTHNDFDSADPTCNSLQDTCHIWTQLNYLALHDFS